jgi:hypothetical protein
MPINGQWLLSCPFLVIGLLVWVVSCSAVMWVDLDPLGSYYGEFAKIFHNTALTESQSLLGFSAWLIDVPFAGSMSGPVLSIGESIQFTTGPFATLKPVLLPLHPITITNVMVGPTTSSGTRNVRLTDWVSALDLPSTWESQPTVRVKYHLDLGGDTGDPMIHRYTQPGWRTYNWDKIGPTHALFVNRVTRLRSGGTLGIAIAGGERRFSTLNPENRQSRSLYCPTERDSWNQQRWGLVTVSHPHGRFDAGYSAFQGWEYLPNLGFDLPVQGWTAVAGTEFRSPVSNRFHSNTTVNWNGFSLEHRPVKGIPSGDHQYWDAGIRHRLQYRHSERVTLTLEQGIEAKELDGSVPIEQPVPPIPPLPDNTRLGGDLLAMDNQVRGSVGISANIKSAPETGTLQPLPNFQPSVNYVSGRGGGIGAGMNIQTRSLCGSVLGIGIESRPRTVDLMERWLYLKGIQCDGTPFLIRGNPDLKGERLHRCQLQFRTTIRYWSYLIGLELSRVEHKIRPVRTSPGKLPGDVPVSSIQWLADRNQDDATLIVQLVRFPQSWLGGRAEYRCHQSWNGVEAGIPDHRAIAEVETRFRTGFRAVLTWQGVSESNWDDVCPEPDTELPAYGVWSLTISQTAFRERLEGIVSVWNLWDQPLRTHPAGPLRPRRLEVAVRIAFDAHGF